MPNYKYEVQDKSGQVTTGVVQADSPQAATAQIKSQGGYILNVSASDTAGPQNLLEKLRSVKIEGGPGLKDVQTFTNQLSVMIKAGINIRSAIAGIAEQVENTKFKKILRMVKDDVESGRPFSEALARHPKVFSPLYVNMVRASELSGNLGHMLERINVYLSDQMETRSMVMGAMIYPAVLLVMSVSAAVFLLTFVLPTFAKLFAGKEDLLPTPTVCLLATSSFMRNYWYILIGIVGVSVGSFLYFIRTPGGRIVWDGAKLKLPVFCRMFRALYITRGLHTMGELVNAGVPMLETLEITAEVSGNARYKQLWMNVHDAVKEGSKIAQPLSRQTLLPPNVVQMISAGEESGKLGEVMRDVAEFYGKQLRVTIKAVTAMIEPLMIVIMGAVVGFIAMSIILPMFKMSSLVK